MLSKTYTFGGISSSSFLYNASRILNTIFSTILRQRHIDKRKKKTRLHGNIDKIQVASLEQVLLYTLRIYLTAKSFKSNVRSEFEGIPGMDFLP